MRGVSLDAKSCYIGVAAGLVGGLAAGAAGGLLYARRHIQAAFDTRFAQEVGAVKADYNDRLKSYLAETGQPFVGRTEADTAGQADNGEHGQTAMGGPAEPGDIQPADVAGRVAYHRIPRRDGGDSTDGSGVHAITDIDLTRGSVGVHPAAEHTEASGEGDGEHGSFPESGDDGPDEDASEDEDAVVHNVFDEDDGGQGPNPVPYGIPIGEFADTPEGYQVLSMTFYAEDKVLIDDATDLPVENQPMIAGELTPAGFGGIAGQADTRFVRNEKLEIDIEITLNHGSWVHNKLGYGKPG